MGKYTYKLILNSESKKAKTYNYNYGSTKGIKLAVAKQSVVISADLTKKYERHEAISKDGYVFPDALKKALLIHIK
ncbi:MAG: hypothetical protein LIO44_03850 [Eubacterium sp.]|nr:hypothetical protein [Eubacterium sp.]